MQENEKKRGGLRVGAGRKKTNRKTKTIAFRVDAEIYEALKLKFGGELNEKLNAWFVRILKE